MVKKATHEEEIVQEEPKKESAHETVHIQKPAMPAVGDSVQYYTKLAHRQVNGIEGPYAAIVTRVNENDVDLIVLSSAVSLSDVLHVTGSDAGDHWFKVKAD